MKLMMLFIVIFMAPACVAIPAFEPGLCISECSRCPGIDCPVICGQLAIGIASTTCHQSAQTVWECAIVSGCSFPMDCSSEVEDYLGCEP